MIVVIFLFLGSVRALIVPVVAIPISLVGAAFLMLAAGFTINLLTLLAIVLSVGLVVDDAIVMVENVERHLQLGRRPVEAALEAARELVGPIIAMTITLAAVYAPIGFQGGLTGTLFREFAFTLASAVMRRPRRSPHGSPGRLDCRLHGLPSFAAAGIPLALTRGSYARSPAWQADSHPSNPTGPFLRPRSSRTGPLRTVEVEPGSLDHGQGR